MWYYVETQNSQGDISGYSYEKPIFNINRMEILNVIPDNFCKFIYEYVYHILVYGS